MLLKNTKAFLCSWSSIGKNHVAKIELVSGVSSENAPIWLLESYLEVSVPIHIVV